jgi:hypothetical protein
LIEFRGVNELGWIFMQLRIMYIMLNCVFYEYQ